MFIDNCFLYEKRFVRMVFERSRELTKRGSYEAAVQRSPTLHLPILSCQESWRRHLAHFAEAFVWAHWAAWSSVWAVRTNKGDQTQCTTCSVIFSAFPFAKLTLNSIQVATKFITQYSCLTCTTKQWNLYVTLYSSLRCSCNNW